MATQFMDADSPTAAELQAFVDTLGSNDEQTLGSIVIDVDCPEEVCAVKTSKCILIQS